MIGQGFPLIGQPLSSAPARGVRTPAPMLLSSTSRYPNDFPMRGGYGYEQLPAAPASPGGPRAGGPAPRLGGISAGPGGRPGRSGIGARSPVLNPFDRVEQRKRLGSSVLRVPVLGVAR